MCEMHLLYVHIWIKYFNLEGQLIADYLTENMFIKSLGLNDIFHEYQ